MVKGSLAPSFGPTHRNLVPDSWPPGVLEPLPVPRWISSLLVQRKEEGTTALEFFLQRMAWFILFSDSPGWKVHPIQALSCWYPLARLGSHIYLAAAH